MRYIGSHTTARHEAGGLGAKLPGYSTCEPAQHTIPKL